MQFYLLFCCIRLGFSFHGHSVEAFTPHQNLHMCIPFEVVEWSQDDMVRLIHSIAIVPLNKPNMLPVSDVNPTKAIEEDKNISTKDLISCGN